MTTVFILLILAVVLLATERLRADMVAMLILVALMFTRVLTPADALSGFANPATVTVACMFVISAGLQQSGVVQYLGDRLLQPDCVILHVREEPRVFQRYGSLASKRG